MDILCIDIMSIISLIHVITQAQPSALPRLGPVLPGAEVSYRYFGTSAEMSWVSSVLGPKCLDTAVIARGILSACPYGRPSHSGIVPSQMKIRSCGFQHLVEQSF